MSNRSEMEQAMGELHRQRKLLMHQLNEFKKLEAEISELEKKSEVCPQAKIALSNLRRLTSGREFQQQRQAMLHMMGQVDRSVKVLGNQIKQKSRADLLATNERSTYQVAQVTKKTIRKLSRAYA